MAVSTIQREPRVVRQNGTAKISGIGWQSIDVTFTTAYTDIPLVCVTQDSDGKATNLSLPVITWLTTTGFRLNYYYNSSEERVFYWQAIGVV